MNLISFYNLFENMKLWKFENVKKVWYINLKGLNYNENIRINFTHDLLRYAIKN